MGMRRRAPLAKSQVITVLVDAKPKRAWGAAYQRFDLYWTGLTVGEFLAAGGTRRDLWYDQDHGFIRVV